MFHYDSDNLLPFRHCTNTYWMCENVYERRSRSCYRYHHKPTPFQSVRLRCIWQHLSRSVDALQLMDAHTSEYSWLGICMSVWWEPKHEAEMSSEILLLSGIWTWRPKNTALAVPCVPRDCHKFHSPFWPMYSQNTGQREQYQPIS